MRHDWLSDVSRRWAPGRAGGRLVAPVGAWSRRWAPGRAGGRLVAPVGAWSRRWAPGRAAAHKKTAARGGRLNRFVSLALF